MKIPVLLLVYNRPNETKKVLNKLRQFKINKLFISSDGSKDNYKDQKLYLQTQKIIKKFKNKNVKIQILDNNYGCKIAVTKAINWFFSQVEEGIILEDDCIPNKSFFDFCKKMLKKYRYSNIKVISGNNFLNGKVKIEEDYYFSKYNHCWGWATWKHAWKLYDSEMIKWERFKETKKWKKLIGEKIERNYWEKIFDLCKKNKIDSWAYPWLYSIWLKEGFTIIPKYNLVKNIGLLGAHNAFNTKFNLKTKNISSKLNHPKKIAINDFADAYVLKNFFKPKNFLYPFRLLYIFKLFINNPIKFIKIIYKKLINKIND